MGDEAFRQRQKDEGSQKFNEPTEVDLNEQDPQNFVPDVSHKMKLEGNIPDQFYEELNKKRALESGAAHQKPQTGFQQRPQQAPPQQARPQNPPQQEFNQYGYQQSIGGSDKLKALLEGTKRNTAIYEAVQLPSMGRFYDGTDAPSDGIVNIRMMTGEEEQILATPRFVRKGHAINMIFQKCLKESINPEELLTVDRTYLLIYLRMISYTNKYDVEVKCPDTDRKFSATIDLNTLYVEPCPDDFGPELEDVMPTSGYKFKYRLSRGKDERDLSEYRERRAKIAGDTATDDTLLYRTCLLLENIEGLEDKQELQILLKNLTINDVSYVRSCINEPPFGIETSVPILSPFTQEEFEVELPLETSFFFPRRRKKN